MKKLWFLAVLALALGVAAIGTSVASATAGTTTTPFKAAYWFTPSAYATCSGANIVKTAPNAFNKDSETCVLSGDDGFFPLGTSTYGYGAWLSDYYYFTLSTLVADQTLTVKKVANGDGTFTLYIVAYY